MAQYFDGIQISDKGMVRLTRSQGRDYVFPARNIKNVSSYTKNEEVEVEEKPFAVNLVESLLSVFGKNKARQTAKVNGLEIMYDPSVVKGLREKFETKYVVLEMADENIYVDVEYTNELYRRLNDAHTYSMKYAEKRYGTFS